jgi:hypothetical protein
VHVNLVFFPCYDYGCPNLLHWDIYLLNKTFHFWYVYRICVKYYNPWTLSTWRKITDITNYLKDFLLQLKIFNHTSDVTENSNNKCFLSSKGLLFLLMFASCKVLCIALSLIIKHQVPIWGFPWYRFLGISVLTDRWFLYLKSYLLSWWNSDLFWMKYHGKKKFIVVA